MSGKCPDALEISSPVIDNLNTSEDSCVYNANKEGVGDNNRNHSFNFSKPQEGFSYYLGILIFAPFLSKLREKGIEFIMQWLIALFLGVKNVEQSKTLNYQSLNNIQGKTVKNLNAQRATLKTLSTAENTEKLFRFNAELLQASRQRDFYYDPHGKHYTGLRKILKGWCSSIHMADKVINMDFIHSVNGAPIYFKTTDNYYDLRERFFLNITEFRCLAGIPDNAIITAIVDRGIYSMEIFERIVRSKTEHIITWEKGYKRDAWDKKIPPEKGYILKTRNNCRDIKKYDFEFHAQKWDKNQDIRRLIVRIPTPGGIIIEVAILTDDLARDAREIILLMFKRWVQENDFKYMIAHFGINEITSYEWDDYKYIKDELENKKCQNGKYKSITNQIQNSRNRLKTVLLKQHQFNAKHINKKELTPTLLGQKQKIDKSIQELTLELTKKSEERMYLEKEVSRLDQLIENHYQKLNTNTKSLMDGIKIIARNMFYLALDPFKQKYNNYRDDHVIFRNLTQSDGNISHKGDELLISIFPKMEHPPKIRKIIGELFESINEGKPVLPDDSGRKISLELIDKI